ncbi:MAG: acetyl-CoA carboxylase biotin carboxyl carrier protein [Burkholderiales bacterium]|jgi:acetyl-CoA carboxylase biotin carboxyl carrier protein|nr:acetyl-CoA carboxylase biotin carboxyl carrier protein [Burkholderiales bacterium]
MSISHDDVERIIRLLEASQFDELHLELEGLKLDLRRRGAAPAAPRVSTAPPAPVPTAASSSAAASPSSAVQQAAPSSTLVAVNTGLVDIKAPMLGTLYLAPKPGAEPFVRVGSQVEPDSVIGIVEVMKLMNSVAAGVSGEVVEVVAPDSQLVEFDQVLIRVRPR